MKRFLLHSLLTIFCLTVTTSCKAQKLFTELSSDPDVESVYIGKGMMLLAKGAILSSGDNDSKLAMSAIKGINSIEIINCDKKAAIDRVRTQAQVIIAKLNLELLMENRENNEINNIYGLTSEKDGENHIKNLVIESIEPKEYSLIHINGKIDLAELLKDQ